MRVELVSLDLETTGLDPRRDVIIEIGAVRMCDGRIIDEYSQLVDPGMPLPAIITEITGIRQEQLLGQPSIREVLPDFTRFVGTTPVIGHNVNFDMDFLARQGALRETLRLDTVELASVLLPRAARYSLGNLVAELGIELKQAHRALEDARATALLYWQLWKLALQLPATTLDEIVGAARGLHWSAEPVFRLRWKRRACFHRPLPIERPVASTASHLLKKRLDCPTLTTGQSRWPLKRFRQPSTQTARWQPVCPTSVNGHSSSGWRVRSAWPSIMATT